MVEHKEETGGPPLRIGLVIDVFSPSRGGGEGYLYNLAKELIAAGHEIHVFADKWDEGISDIEFHRVKARFPGKTLPMMMFALRSRQAVESAGMDIVHVVGKALGMNVMNSHGGIEAKWLKQNFRSIRSPFYRVFKKTMRLLNPRHYFIPWLERRQYTDHGMVRCIAISDMLARDIREAWAVPPEKLKVVYNGVDTALFNPGKRETHRAKLRAELGVAPDSPVMLHVSNNFRLKGLADLIDAMPRVLASGHGRGATLWVVGRGNERPYARQAARLGIGGSVRFLGVRKGLDAFYAGADVYAHPTYYDACSLVVLEAMASGLSVVTTSTNGACGYVEEGVSGFVISDPRDHETLANRIVKCLDPASNRRMGEAARKRAEQFPKEKNAEQVMAVYREVVGRGVGRLT